MRHILIALCSVLGLFGCKKNGNDSISFPTVKEQNKVQETFSWDTTLTRDVYTDKVRGFIIGSAIGDAMGAPTEMWHRDAIVTQLGYIDKLDVVIREGSPEGPWDFNMPAGGTTDDTRWKYLMTEFMSRQTLSAVKSRDFAQFIIDIYLDEKDDINQDNSFLPEELETQVRHMTWLQEWARVAKPYVDNDLDGYHDAINRFYGGEMACAGMLYAPSIGAYFPANPEKAYAEGFKLSLFDLGYARDITGLTAAYVSKAMQPGISYQEIGAITRTVDPQKYAESRLVGRIANRIYQEARQIAYDAQGMTESDIDSTMRIPENYPYSKLYFTQVHKAYERLDEKLQDIPFHAGEIHLINLTAIEFCKGDFKKALEFVVNYGRDNDTVAAVTGAILGAYVGEKGLPGDWKKTVLTTNKETVGIDLEALAKKIVQQTFNQ
ncbi:MAG: ADP-ribosylglycohydrolase family protein [Saprospiraceae bacterium]|nr:ADP-ribosylglycohydrolase family protein [Saprospiraceae bacterium]